MLRLQKHRPGAANFGTIRAKILADESLGQLTGGATTRQNAMEAAIGAAETGHLVFATLHTTGAAGTITRVIDAFPVNQQAQVRVQLSTALIAVVSQQLVQTLWQANDK